MRFPPEFIERLKNHLPLSEVIGRRVSIKRQGREFAGLCPFHKEKSPSFTVNDEKGFFHCFGCGAHGDAIGFIKDYERVDYREAVEKLAGEAGIPVPQMTREAVESERKRLTLEDAVTMAAQWFKEQLYSAAGKEAREYLRERGLRLSTAEKFGLGFAPGARDALKSALMKQGISEAMLVEAGLLATPDEGSAYDRFRARLIFPIKSAQGKVIAFGGRLLPQAQPGNAAKYLNSPETPLFKKGEILFAYDIARRSAGDGEPLIVSEGYMDVLALHQAGFETAVAPLGTAVTEAQLKLLWRVSQEPVFCLDSDAAGKSAAMRAIELALPLLKPNQGLKFALLPAGEDPDSLIHKSGAGAMREVLNHARILSKTLWESALQHYGAETAEKKAALQHYLTQSADRIADATMKHHMRGYFREQVFSLGRQKKGAKPNAYSVHPATLPEANDDKSHLKRLEEQIVALVILHPDILHQSEIEEHFGHMDFTQPVLDKLRAHTLEISADMQSLDSASLKAALSARGHAEKVEILLHSKNAAVATMFQPGIRENPRMAQQAFEQAYSAYTMKKLEHEMHEAARRFESDMSEQNQDRLHALKKQIEQINRNRYSAVSDEQNF